MRLNCAFATFSVKGKPVKLLRYRAVSAKASTQLRRFFPILVELHEAEAWTDYSLSANGMGRCIAHADALREPEIESDLNALKRCKLNPGTPRHSKPKCRKSALLIPLGLLAAECHAAGTLS